MAIAFYIISLLVIVILVSLKTSWYAIISIAILCAAWSIADAIRDGSDKISGSINKSIRDAITEMKDAILEHKLK